jgi:hypothetical protein
VYAGLRTSAVLHCLLCAAGSPSTSFAQTLAELAQSAAFAPLDGQEFEAGIVQQGDSAAPSEPLIDRLSFENGTFSSLICERYGFVPSAYWVRGTADAIEFTAILESPTDGVMEWRGTVKDGKLDGTMRWTRERWYWTIEAEHHIVGEIVPQLTAPIRSD